MFQIQAISRSWLVPDPAKFCMEGTATRPVEDLPKKCSGIIIDPWYRYLYILLADILLYRRYRYRWNKLTSLTVKGKSLSNRDVTRLTNRKLQFFLLTVRLGLLRSTDQPVPHGEWPSCGGHHQAGQLWPWKGKYHPSLRYPLGPDLGREGRPLLWVS
jgi:hypothetical protein